MVHHLLDIGCDSMSENLPSWEEAMKSTVELFQSLFGIPGATTKHANANRP